VCGGGVQEKARTCCWVARDEGHLVEVVAIELAVEARSAAVQRRLGAGNGVHHDVGEIQRVALVALLTTAAAANNNTCRLKIVIKSLLLEQAATLGRNDAHL
jgi:hypothetical protein